MRHTIQKLLFVMIILISFNQLTLAIEEGDLALDLETSSEAKINFDQYKGQLIYLDFWASWCPPCQLSLPWMNELATKYKNKNLKIIAVGLDKDKSKAEELIAEIAPDYQIIFDPKGELASLYKLPSMPSSYLIGKDQKILKVFKGFSEKHKKEIEESIEEALGG